MFCWWPGCIELRLWGHGVYDQEVDSGVWEMGCEGKYKKETIYFYMWITTKPVIRR